MMWIAVMLIAFAAVVAIMKIVGRQDQAEVALAAGVRA
jgi:hypothetical protein